MSLIKNPGNPILMVDDEQETLDSTEFLLNSAGLNNIVKCNDSKQVPKLLEENNFVLLLLDLTMPGLGGEEILQLVSTQYPDLAVIVITGANELETAVNCMRNGAADYMVKPVEKSRLISGVDRVLQLQESIEENTKLKASLLSHKHKHPEYFSDIITNNQKMVSIFKYIEASAKTRKPFLITGETGVGKELFARAIHKASEREGNFVAVNVAGLDDNLFSDTLFGHVKGAYTSADKMRRGLIETAQGGSLFLDEIGDLSIQSQTKLLRLIQENEYFPLGSDIPKKAYVRIIVSTLQDFHELFNTETFRRDLFYRLKVHHIHVPPLRERKDDLAILIDHFVEKSSSELGMEPPQVPLEIKTIASNYHFPGNVRELESLIFELVSQNDTGRLSVENIRERLQIDISSAQGMSHIAEQVENVFESCNALPSIKHCNDLLVQEAMRRSDNNQSTAAMLLGISQPALSKRLQKMEDDL